jgi:hypothetical protein
MGFKSIRRGEETFLKMMYEELGELYQRCRHVCQEAN